jgi:hypothetical protein
MKKKTRIVAGSTGAIALLIAGGAALALPAQASTAPRATSVVSPTHSGSTDATPGESATENASEGPDTDNVQHEDTNGHDDAEENGSEVENTSDDVNGVAVEDGAQD